jgi:hypothetical protein
VASSFVLSGSYHPFIAIMVSIEFDHWERRFQQVSVLQLLAHQ